MSLEKGLSAEQSYVVSEKDLATNWGGEVPVLSSPVLIGLFERTCMMATDAELPQDEMTVGMGFDIMHLAPTPSSETIVLEAILDDIVTPEGTQIVQLLFYVSARDDKGLISTGTHIRAIVNRGRFLGKVRRRQGIDTNVTNLPGVRS